MTAARRLALDALLVVMGLCFAAGLAGLQRALMAPAYGAWLAALFALVTIEGTRFAAHLERMQEYSAEWWRAHGLELLGLAVVARAFTWLFADASAGIAALPILDANLLATFGFGVAAWGLTYLAARRLGFLAAALAMQPASDGERVAVPYAESAEGRREQLATLLGSGALLIAVLQGLVAVVTSAPPGGPEVLLIYVMALLLLLAGTRASIAESAWRQLRAAVEGGVSGRWLAAAIGLAAGLGLPALWLGARARGVPLSAGRDLIQTVVQAIMFAALLVFNLVWLLVVFMMTLACRIIGCVAPDRPASIIPPQPPQTDSGGGWLQWVMLAVLIMCFGLILAVLLRMLLAQRNAPGRPQPRLSLAATLRTLLGNLRALWTWLRRRALPEAAQMLRGAWHAISARERGRGEARGLNPWLQTRADTPRERILFYYRALLTRNARRGLPRQPGQTPAEYAAIMRAATPEADEPIGALTNAVELARYGRDEPSLQLVTRVRLAIAAIRTLRAANPKGL